MSQIPKRHRWSYSIHSPIYCGQLWITANAGVTWSNAGVSSYDPRTYGRYYASSDVCVDATHPGPPYRSGGPLGVYHYDDSIRVLAPGTRTAWMSPNIGYRYIGGFVNTGQPQYVTGYTSTQSSVTADSNPAEVISSRGDIESHGATGWKRFRPGNPTADVGVFLGEFRDVPRMLSGTAKFFHESWKAMGGNRRAFGPKVIADAWLNSNFGWLPFISDLRKFYKAYVSLADRLERIRRQNGKWVQRGGSVLTDSRTEKISESTNTSKTYPLLPSYFYSSPTASGNHSCFGSYSRHVWFEGRFRYWIPDIGTPEWERRAILSIFGAMPCPSLVWELTPWSWLVDWFSNVGDVVANMSTGYAENLAAQYAYIMGTTEYSGTWSTYSALKESPFHDSSGYTSVYKHRVGASPFGFGLTSSDLSVRQWSILSALGLSRSRIAW